MNKKTIDGFRLGLDDEAVIKDEPGDRAEEKPALTGPDSRPSAQIKQLGRRLTVLTLLLPLLTAAILTAIYIQVNEKVAIFQDMGVSKVKTVQAELETRLTALEQRQSTLDATIAEVAAESEKKAAAGLQEIKKSEAALKAAMGEAKTDKQVSQTALTQVEKQAEALSAEIKTVAAGLKAVEEKTKALDAIGVQMAKIQAEVGKAVGDKLDAKALATALEQERKTYREMMTQVTRNWEKQIEGLQLKVAMIERLASMPRPPSTPASPVTAPSAPPPGGKTGSSGVFNEQDIKEVR